SEANQVRINELARELEVKAKAIIDLLPGYGVTEKKTHSSSIPEDVAVKVRQKIKGGAEPQASAPAVSPEAHAREAAAKAARTRPASTAPAPVAATPSVSAPAPARPPVAVAPPAATV